MIQDQLETVILEYVENVRARVLARLDVFFLKRSQHYWWTIYVVSGVLLYETAFASHDRRRHAQQNLVQVGPPATPTADFCHTC